MEVRKEDRCQIGKSWIIAKEDHVASESFAADADKWNYLVDARALDDIEAKVSHLDASISASEAATEAAEQATRESKSQTAAQADAMAVFESVYHQIDLDDWLYVICDAKGYLLWGIRTDGSVYQEKGMPEETRAWLEKLHTLEDYENAAWLYTIVDSAGNIVWGIRKSGDVYEPKGIPTEVANALLKLNARLDGMTSFKIIESDDYAYVIADAEDNVMFGIDHKGRVVVNGVKGVVTVEQFASADYLFAVTDSAGNLLFGIRKDGTFCASKFELPKDLAEQIAELTGQDWMAEDADEQEFIYKIVDAGGHIVFGVFSSGRVYMPKGEAEETKRERSKFEERMKALAERLDTFRGGTGDWSNKASMEIAMPKIAYINIITDYPLHRLTKADRGGIEGVNCDIPCEMEFWDNQGNYFRKPAKISAQGNSSMAFMKLAIAPDFYVDSTFEEGFKIRFGDNPAFDSYQLKAYYTDPFRCRCAISYALCEEMYEARPFNDDRPYKYQYAKNYGTSSQGLASENADLDQNFETGAKCIPQCFPCIVMQNMEFYGVYSFQTKKHRDNYQMSRKKVKHIHLDGTLGADQIWSANGDASKIGWTGFEIRNPKPKEKDWTMTDTEGNAYDGDHPKEIIGSDSENYDSENTSHVNTAKVKDSILKLSKRMTELRTKESELNAEVTAGTKTSQERDSEMRTLISKYFMPSFMVDYILETNLMADDDVYAKNWQWLTWDGTLWVACFWDHDGVMGAFHIGQWQSAPSAGWLGNSLAIPSGWIIKYFMPEMQQRWQELRDAGIFNARHITMLLKDWLGRVGYDWMEMEYEKWDESPCNRPSCINEGYWTRSTSYLTGWAVGTTYGKNGVCSRGGKAWKSLVAGNVGIDPLEDDGTNWEDVTWNADKEYAVNEVCYHGRSLLFGFKCKVACQGQRPITKFYTGFVKNYIAADGDVNGDDKPFASIEDLPSAKKNEGKWVTVVNPDDATKTLAYEAKGEKWVLRASKEGREDGITNHYPQELGCYDSIYRVYNWLQKRIENMDVLLDYETSGDMSNARAISAGTINDIINGN